MSDPGRMGPTSLHAIAVVGPTASGKTALGLELARRLGGEILSADSRQLYRRLDAGTAKPEGAWSVDAAGGRVFVAAGVPYHLVDLLEPSERVDAGAFARLARPVLDAVRARGRRPILVGGTGLYLRALLEGLDPLPPRDPALREELAELVEANGRAWLHEELARLDPEAARRIPPNNLHRVMRALEVCRLTGGPVSAQWSRVKGGAPAALYLGIAWERAALLERIRARAEGMFPRILAEVRRLVPAECTGREPGFASLGYPEALAVLRGELDERRGLEALVKATAAYAKRQATWFRNQAAVRWIPAGDGDPRAWADAAEGLLAEEAPSSA